MNRAVLLVKLFQEIEQVLAVQLLDARRRIDQRDDPINPRYPDLGEKIEGFPILGDQHVTVLQFQLLEVGNHRVG